MQLNLTKDIITKGESHLMSCKVMSSLIKRHRPCLLADREFLPFNDLVTSIISQQLSVKAATAIKSRLNNLVPIISPEGICDVSHEKMRSTGLSERKVRYIKSLALNIISGQINLSSLQVKSDEEVVSILTALPGIGTWTAEMFLIFCLKRPNILSLSDSSLQRAACQLYGKNARLENLRTLWNPYCSIASWYLWRHLDS